MNQKLDIKFSLIVFVILFIAFSRIIPHMPNYSPMTAIALFGIAHLDKKWIAVMVIFIATFLSDLVLNNTIYANMFSGFTVFYEGFIFQYLALAFILMIGHYGLTKLSVKNIVIATLCSSIAFFIISNFGAFVSLPMYPKTFTGLMTAFAAGIPFLKATFLSDLLYSSVLFGGYYLLQAKYSKLKLAHVRYA